MVNKDYHKHRKAKSNQQTTVKPRLHDRYNLQQ